MAADHSTQNVYVADSYNHQIRRIDLTDRPDIVVSTQHSFGQTLGKVLEHNLGLITLVVFGSMIFCCVTYLICRTCWVCPVYQRMLHEHRVDSMQWGVRA